MHSPAMRSVSLLACALALAGCKDNVDLKHPCSGAAVRGQVVGSVQQGPTAVPRVRLPDGTEVALSADGTAAPLGWACARAAAAEPASVDAGVLEPGQVPTDSRGWILVAPGGAIVGRFPPGAQLNSLPPGFQAVHESTISPAVLEMLDKRPTPGAP